MAGSDKRVEAGLLFLVLELEPEHLTLTELTQRMSVDAPAKSNREASAVGQAVARLKKAGLLSEKDGKIAPTCAALCFNALYF